MSKQLFLEILREARRLKNVLGWDWTTRRAYLLGMIRAFLIHYDDIRAGQNIQDYWKCQASGAER